VPGKLIPRHSADIRAEKTEVRKPHLATNRKWGSAPAVRNIHNRSRALSQFSCLLPKKRLIKARGRMASPEFPNSVACVVLKKRPDPDFRRRASACSRRSPKREQETHRSIFIRETAFRDCKHRRVGEGQRGLDGSRLGPYVAIDLPSL